MSDLVCSKCGGTEILTRHHVGSSYWGDTARCPHGVAAQGRSHRGDEHLHRTCQTCRYDWTDDVLAPVSAGGPATESDEP